MEGKDNIKDLFNEKLASYEANVRPEIWTNISSQIGVTSGAAATGGFSVLTKVIIGISVAASIVGLGVVINSSESKNKQAENTVIIEKEAVVAQEKDIEKKELPEYIVTEQIVESLTDTGSFSNGKEEEYNANDKIEDNTPLINYKIIKEERPNDKPVIIQKEHTPEILIKDIVAPEIIEDRNDSENNEESIVLQDLPNVFTPNGDNVNDFLSIETNGLTDFNIVVLDHKSAIVYKSNDPDFIWNGIGMNGEIVPRGNYIYYITARDAKGYLFTRHSTLRIER